MTIRSFVLGAVLLSVAAPAAFAASSGDDSFLYRDKANNGGAAVTMTSPDSTSDAEVAAFAAVDGTVTVSKGAAGDYWIGKSDNGFNE
jgi:hypothetical protein